MKGETRRESQRKQIKNLSFHNHHCYLSKNAKHLDKHLERETNEQRKRKRKGVMTKMEGREGGRECLADKC